MANKLLPFLVYVIYKDFLVSSIYNEDWDAMAEIIAFQSNNTTPLQTIRVLKSKTGNNHILIAGSAIHIVEWLGDRCPEEVFSDAAISGGDEGETIEVEKWYWDVQDKEVMVQVGNDDEIMPYSKWVAEPTMSPIEETESWVDKVPWDVIYRFVSIQRYTGDNPREYLRLNWYSFFTPVIPNGKDSVRTMRGILEFREIEEADTTILMYLVKNYLDNAIIHWKPI
jgi:hypothetical protein